MQQIIHVHSTWKTADVPMEFVHAYNSWNQSNVCRHFYDDNYVFDELFESCVDMTEFNKIQLIDLWRYIHIFNHGGLYVDMDIGLKENGIQKLLSMTKSCNLILFRESPTFIESPLFFFVYAILWPLSDHPRFYQFRQSIFYAAQESEPLKTLVQKISDIDVYLYRMKYTEPQFTFELSGPGIFTDVMNTFIQHDDTCIIEYTESKRIIDYHSTGTWRDDFSIVRPYQIVWLSLITNVLMCLFIYKIHRQKGLYSLLTSVQPCLALQRIFCEIHTFLFC